MRSLHAQHKSMYLWVGLIVLCLQATHTKVEALQPGNKLTYKVQVHLL